MIINSDMLLTIFVLLTAFYFLILIGGWIGLNRLQFFPPTDEPTISIVIAARNEAHRIEPCLKSLEKLDYPADRYEIIFVDDHSTDRTAEMIQSFVDRHPNWNLICLSNQSKKLSGKKDALLQGIARARGEIIFTTDADCVVPPGWLKYMAGYFQPGVAMVLGYSPLTPGKGWWYRLLEFDNLFSAVAVAAPTKVGYPFNSVGRNMAYRKSAYEDAGSFLALKQYRSGDDVHLTERFRELRLGKIDFCAHPETFVQTFPPETFQEFWHQQIRKNSKILKQTPTTILFSFITLVYYLLFWGLPFIAPTALTLWSTLFFIKFVLEFIDLHQASRIFHQQHLIPWFPLMQLIYPFYIIFFTILGAFQLYRWKDRDK